MTFRGPINAYLALLSVKLKTFLVFPLLHDPIINNLVGTDSFKSLKGTEIASSFTPGLKSFDVIVNFLQSLLSFLHFSTDLH